MALAPRMRKVVLTDLAGDCLARFELPEAASVADVERLFVHESPHFSDAGLLMAAQSGDRLLSRDETLVEISPNIGAEIIWVVIPDTMNAQEGEKWLRVPRHLAEVYALHKVQAARVLVVGCGAVGANAFLALVLSGFRHIALMDFDALEPSNCSRAAGLFRPEDAGKKKAGILKAWAEGFMPGIPVKDYPMDVADVGALFAGRFDAVICAVDNARAVLHIARITAEVGVPVLRGATNGFNASVEVVRNQNGACLGCFKKDDALSEGCGVRYQKAILDNQTPTCQVSSALAANRIVRELILLLTEGTAERRVYESAKGSLYTAVLRRDPNCPNHEEGSSPDSTSLPGTCEGTTLAQLLRITGGHALILEDPLVTEVVCGCGKHRKIMKPLRHLSENDVHGCECAAALIPPPRCVTQSLLDLSSEPAHLGAPLAALGVRHCAFLPVMSAAGEVRQFYFEDDMR